MIRFDEDRLATVAEADAEYVRNVGYENQDCAWILSDREVWYRNPFYSGPAVPHPESDDFEPGSVDPIVGDDIPL